MDFLTPPCRTSAGCIIPPLNSANDRIMKFRAMRIRLGDLVDSQTVHRAFAVEFGPLDWDDLELLAIAEELLMAGKDSEHGERC